MCVVAGLALALSFALQAQSPTRDRFTPARGHLIAIGGGAIGPEIWSHMASLAGGWDAPLVYIPTAAESEPGPNAAEFLRRAGFNRVTLLHTRNRAEANSDSWLRPLREAKIVFFGGGRQWRLVDVYSGTKAMDLFAAVLERDGILAGTSAGATILGSYLVRGARSGNTVMMAPGYEEGFGYLKKMAIDQHLLKRGRENDLWEVIDKRPDLLGIGIDEGTAVHFAADRFRVYGASLAAVYDAGYGKQQPRHFYIAPGGAYDLQTRRIID